MITMRALHDAQKSLGNRPKPVEIDRRYEPDSRYSPTVKRWREESIEALDRLAKGESEAYARASGGGYDVIITSDYKTFTKRNDRPEWVPSGSWMDWWEPDHGVSKKEYEKLPLRARAQLEAKLQLEKWAQKEYEDLWVGFYAPRAYDKWWWDGRKSIPEKARFDLSSPEMKDAVHKMFAKAAGGAL